MSEVVHMKGRNEEETLCGIAIVGSKNAQPVAARGVNETIRAVSCKRCLKQIWLSTQEEIKEAFKAVTPEKIRAGIAAMEQDDEDRRCRTGKYAPPVGVCLVCLGKVVAEVRFRHTGMLGGLPPPSSIKHWSCEGCGLMYAKIPPNRMPNGEEK